MFFAIEIEGGEKGIMKVEQDLYEDNPRNWSNLSKMLCFHRRYSLGDVDLADELGISADDFGGWEEVERWIWNHEDPLFVWPVSMLDHSGISIWIGYPTDPWDSGQIGFIYVRKEDVRKNFEVKRISKKLKKEVERIVQAEFETYKKYVEGDVYRITIKTLNGDEDSLGGFYLDSWGGYSEVRKRIHGNSDPKNGRDSEFYTSFRGIFSL